MRVIKRYRNRRLYDTESSRTITQFELARLIQEGAEVQVIDSDTGDDITLLVLRRIMADSGGWNNVREATEFFREAIRKGGDASMSILRNTVLAFVGALHVTKNQAEKIIDELIKKGELDKSKRKEAVMELLDKAEKSTETWRKKLAKETEKATTSVKGFAKEYGWATQSDMKKIDNKISRLQKRIRDLESSVGKITEEEEE